MDSEILETLVLDLGDDENSAEDQSIGNLVEQTRTFAPADPGSAVQTFFNEHPSAEGVVIVDGQTPLGLVMRNDFFQKIGTLYGRDLYMHRPVKLIMNASPLVVDVSVDIATISLIAMNRPHDQLYDMVLITEHEHYVGVVSIKRFMIELSKNREKEIELLKNQKEILHKANEAEIRHRKQIEEKSLELAEKNDSIKNLMDNAGQGFLSFGPDLSVSSEYSLECVQIFRMQLGGRNFLELMSKHIVAESGENMAKVFDNIFSSSKSLREKVYLSLLPTEFVIYDKNVSIEYKVIKQGAQKKMMLILTDITEKKKLEAAMTEERNNVKMVVKALTKQSDVLAAIEEFSQFIGSEAKAIIESGEPKAALAEIFRIVHTHKGDFGQLGLHNTGARLHVMEDALSVLTARPEPPTRQELTAVVSEWDAQAILQADVDTLTNMLGKSFFEKDERYHVSLEALEALEGKVLGLPDNPDRQDILSALYKLRLRPLKDIMAEYQDYLQALAGRLGKSVEPLRITGDDVFVDKDNIQKFVKSLVHVFRNMIDHGIESPEERLESGKREFGMIECHVEKNGDAVCLAVSDDGKGIDTSKVLSVAMAKGLITQEQSQKMTPEQIYDLLFMDSLSTKDQVSALSGRGVGLAAVKAEIERLGGGIKVDSQLGHGSKFKFILPLS